MGFDDKDIRNMRKGVLLDLKKRGDRRLAQIIKKRGYLVAVMRMTIIKDVPTERGIERVKESSQFIFYDFTCRQEDHLSDLLDYTSQLYNQFNGSVYPYFSA